MFNWGQFLQVKEATVEYTDMSGAVVLTTLIKSGTAALLLAPDGSTAAVLDKYLSQGLRQGLGGTITCAKGLDPLVAFLLATSHLAVAG
eukprot:970210-Prymnesium_polylepis.1